MRKYFLGLAIIFFFNSAANASALGDIVAKKCLCRYPYKLTNEQVQEWRTIVKGNYRHSDGYINFEKPYPESSTGKCIVATYYDDDRVHFSKVSVELKKNMLEFN